MSQTKCNLTGELVCKCGYERSWLEETEADIQGTLMGLFSDHATYTVFVMRGIIDGGKDVEVNKNRLIANQIEIGDTLAMYVGVEHGKAIGLSLTEHIKMVGDIVTMATALLKNKQGTVCALEAKKKELFAQGDDLARLLSRATKDALAEEEAKQMWRIHNGLIIEMMEKRLASLYKEEQETYDAYDREIIALTSTLYHSLPGHVDQEINLFVL